DQPGDAGVGGGAGAGGGVDGGGSGGSGGSGGTQDGGSGTGGGPSGCKSKSDCAASTSTPVCDPSSSKCVECLPTDDVCPAGLYCEGTSCSIGCKNNADCGTLTCDPTKHVCTGCSADPECPTGTVCDIPTQTCIAKCATKADCPVSFDCCNEKCENIATNLSHCGACATACAPAHGTGACANGICSVAACDAGYANCDASPTNGCEINTNTTATHCGGCGSTCSNNNGTPSCSAGKCQIACNSGFVDCDGNALGNGCEVNVTTDTKNCGTCGNNCPVSAPNCSSGSCKSNCAPLTADCDGNTGNGCETLTSQNHLHCGGCNQACGANQYCTSSSCTLCPSGKSDCDGSGANACEATTASDPNNCGACGKKCGSDGTCGCAAGVCSGGTVYFSDDFSDNSKGWSLAGEWAIGPTQVSSGHEEGNPDPASDHSTTADNGVAGIVLGGNHSIGIHGFDYITSPVINLSAATGSVKLSFWRWLNCDFVPYVTDTIEVYNGTSWVTLWSNASVGDNLIEDYSWQRYEYDVTAHKNAAFRVRFGHKVDEDSEGYEAWIMSGWNIDDLSLASGTCN
ncbi:MAG TPA: hypothetical protein PKA88_11835, partial [Polyangiaceae bacterium]|nr:hypothetical protein [Polyangiaceae bacterium]